MMNFTYTVLQPADKAWGTLSSDGSWNGMVRMLQDKTVDLCEKILNNLPLKTLNQK